MSFGKDIQKTLTLPGNLQSHPAAVSDILLPIDQPGLFTTLAEFNHRMMAQTHPFRRIRHRHLLMIRTPGDLQQQLMLLRL